MKYDRQLPGWLRPDAAARELGWSVAKVLRACRDGLIPGVQKSASGWYLPEGEVAKMTAAVDEGMGLSRERREEIYRQLQEMIDLHGLRDDGWIPESVRLRKED